MKSNIIFVVSVLTVATLPLLGIWYYLKSSCAERGEMEGYKITKIVATKCYGTNNGYNWEKIWY